MEDKAELLLHAGRPGRRATVALIEGGFGREVQCGVPALDGELLQQPDGMSCGQIAPSRVGHGNAPTLKMVVTDKLGRASRNCRSARQIDAVPLRRLLILLHAKTLPFHAGEDRLKRVVIVHEQHRQDDAADQRQPNGAVVWKT